MSYAPYLEADQALTDWHHACNLANALLLLKNLVLEYPLTPKGSPTILLSTYVFGLADDNGPVVCYSANPVHLVISTPSWLYVSLLELVIWDVFHVRALLLARSY